MTFRFQNFPNLFDGIDIGFEKQLFSKEVLVSVSKKLVLEKISVSVCEMFWYHRVAEVGGLSGSEK